jgi:hypothetical protein
MALKSFSSIQFSMSYNNSCILEVELNNISHKFQHEIVLNCRIGTLLTYVDRPKGSIPII